MIRVIPNSHHWSDLNQLLTHFRIDEMHANKKQNDNSISLHEPITKDYLLIGFKNTLKHEYEIEQFGEPKNAGPIFSSIENIIKYIEQPDFNLKSFINIIGNTLHNNINLKPKFKMERTEVYKCLDTERDYQDLRWTPRRETNGTPDEEKPPAEWINYIEYHISKAKEQVYLLNDEDALAEVRKVAALAIRCLELHGCPERIIPEELKTQE